VTVTEAAVLVRDYEADRDGPAVRAAFVELQDFEHGLDPRMPTGEPIADRYLERMFERGRVFDGAVLVAECAGEVVGFVSVWTRYRSNEPDDDPAPHGFVSDLVVLASHRGRGIGRALLRAAEARARAAGADRVLLSVKAGNAGARALYAAEGYAEVDLYLEKALEPSGRQ
jgi:ribosomal protein S18 acetylase RimI-like enzyme